jgi:hypothetical protein
MNRSQKITLGSHYNPRFILQNFVDAKGFVNCYRLNEQRWYRNKPEEAGIEKNLYRVTHPDVADPQSLEYAFSESEGLIGPTISSIVEKSRLSGTSEETSQLNFFVADSAFRVPHAKTINEYLADEVMRNLIASLFERPENWRHFQESRRAKGEEVLDSEQAKYIAMARSGAVQLKKYEGWIWKFLAIEHTKTAITILSDFSWRLWTCPDAAKACIVTSDTPVGLLHVRDAGAGMIGTTMIESGVIGNWRLATQVSIALSKAHVLIGHRRGAVELGPVRDDMAWFNTITCWFAATVFSSSNLPRFQLPDGQVTGISHFASKLDQHRRTAPPIKFIFPPPDWSTPQV